MNKTFRFIFVRSKFEFLLYEVKQDYGLIAQFALQSAI